MKFKYAEQDLAVYGHNVNDDISSVKQRLAQEYEAFTHTLNDWAKLKSRKFRPRNRRWQKKSIKWMTS